MCNFTISEEEFNDLADLRRHVGLVFGLAAGAQSTVEADKRIELRASELAEIFSFIEGRLRDVVEAAEQRYRVSSRSEGGVPVLSAYDLYALIDTAAGEHSPRHEPVLRGLLDTCVQIDPEMDRARQRWEVAISARDQARKDTPGQATAKDQARAKRQVKRAERASAANQ